MMHGFKRHIYEGIMKFKKSYLVMADEAAFVPQLMTDFHDDKSYNSSNLVENNVLSR